MNWKKIGKHVFLSPLYGVVIAGALGMVYVFWLAISSFSVWLFTDWFNIFIAIGIVWAFSIVTYVIDKIDPALFYD